MAEMKYAEKINQMSNMLADENIPPEETFTERLTHHYYDTARLPILKLVRLHEDIAMPRDVLAGTVFSQFTDENVVSLVKNMLIDPKQHELLRQLHDMFSKEYWKGRMMSAQKLCPTWDVITISDRIGLIQFAQLCLRRKNILERNSPVVELELRCVVYSEESPIDGSHSYGSTVYLVFSLPHIILHFSRPS